MNKKTTKKEPLEFATIREDSIEQEKTIRAHADAGAEKKKNRRNTQRRDGVERREMIRFEDERRDTDERRKGSSTSWDTL